jgi:signal transduction histidine kinase
MAQPDALSGRPAARAPLLGRADNRLVRAVGRVPVKVRTKLLVAFAVIAALLVAVGFLGLRVLGQSNSRVESLGTLQLRAATYQSLQTQADQLRQLLAIRVAEDPNLNTYLGGRVTSALSGRTWTLVDHTIAAALSQLGPTTNETRFGFVPPPKDEALLDRIRSDYRRFSQMLTQIIAFDRAGTTSKKSQPFLTKAIDADDDLGAVTDQLASTTRAQTDALIAQNRGAYAASRNLVIEVGGASILLALLLGLVLSRSLIGPIQRTEARVAEIAAGDFSRHVEVPNRDELGALAVNLNRMNDELRRLYEELETVSQHKSEFLTNMSHELRTPLNAIIGFSELLQQQSFGELNEQQLGYVEDVLNAGRHLLSLINDILDLSKVEAGRMELDLSDVSLRHVLENGVTMHTQRAAREDVTLGLTLDPDEITIRADERKLRQVVFNLLSNAVKFTPAGGRVDVSAQMTDGVVGVVVTDTGPGIASDDQGLIFEEFRQARGNPSKGHEGTGLGLPLSRRFVELHGGRLWVESVQGEGSTFCFTLPIKPRE